MVGYAWSGLGASFGPALLLSLWWKRTTGWGVFAGLLTGTVMTIVWASFPGLSQQLSERLVAFLAALMMVAAVSLATSPRCSKEP